MEISMLVIADIILRRIMKINGQNHKCFYENPKHEKNQIVKHKSEIFFSYQQPPRFHHHHFLL